MLALKVELQPARRRLRFALAFGLAVVTAVAMTGCSIKIHSQPDPSIGADTMLVSGDTGSPTFQRVFNPYLPNKRTATNYVFEPLILQNPLNGDLTPWLASEYTQPDASTIDMTIRSGVLWSDGNKMTVDDVAFTFALLKKFPALDTFGAWSNLASVEVKDDHAIFHLKSPDSPAIGIIGQTLIVSENHWKDVKEPATFQDPDPVGTGPFMVGAFAPQQYSMDRNPQYWQVEKVEMKHLVFPATNTQLDLVAKGYDWGYAFISDVEGTWGEANSHNEWWFPAGGVISLIPNLTKPPFDDVNLRQGISHALDRTRIADTATEGYMKEATTLGLLLPNQKKFLDPSIADSGLITQDKDAALASFEKAGYTMQGNQLVNSSGEQLSFAITTANGYTDWLRAVQEVRKQLDEVGIKVTVKAPQPAGYQSAIANGDFEMAMGGTGAGDVFQAYNNLLSSNFYAPSGEQAVNNFERFESADADRLLAEYQATTDADKQKQIIYELQKITYDELPVIGLYYGGLWGLFSTQKYTGWPSEQDPYMAPQTYGVPPLSILTHLKRNSDNQ